MNLGFKNDIQVYKRRFMVVRLLMKPLCARPSHCIILIGTVNYSTIVSYRKPIARIHRHTYIYDSDFALSSKSLH